MDAVLWDMDGLLVDTEPLWTVAETELVARFGGVFDAAAKAAIVGTRLDTAVPLLLGHLGVAPTPKETARSAAFLLQRMVQLFGTALVPRAGALRLLADVHAAGVPQALVSSSYRVLVDAALAQGYGPFAVTVSGDEVVHAKPDPEPYLTAAARLGVDPRRCVVLEDSPVGVQAAEAAGCAVVAVPSLPGLTLSAQPRRAVMASLTAVDVPALRCLVERPD